MSGTEKEVRRRLFELQDLKYKEFTCKLIPTVNPETVIGRPHAGTAEVRPGAFRNAADFGVSQNPAACVL